MRTSSLVFALAVAASSASALPQFTTINTTSTPSPISTSEVSVESPSSASVISTPTPFSEPVTVSTPTVTTSTTLEPSSTPTMESDLVDSADEHRKRHGDHNRDDENLGDDEVEGNDSEKLGDMLRNGGGDDDEGVSTTTTTKATTASATATDKHGDDMRIGGGDDETVSTTTTTTTTSATETATSSERDVDATMTSTTPTDENNIPLCDETDPNATRKPCIHVTTRSLADADRDSGMDTDTGMTDMVVTSKDGDKTVVMPVVAVLVPVMDDTASGDDTPVEDTDHQHRHGDKTHGSMNNDAKHATAPTDLSASTPTNVPAGYPYNNNKDIDARGAASPMSTGTVDDATTPCTYTDTDIDNDTAALAAAVSAAISDTTNTADTVDKTIPFTAPQFPVSAKHENEAFTDAHKTGVSIAAGAIIAIAVALFI